jgi:hypothetical protein
LPVGIENRRLRIQIRGERVPELAAVGDRIVHLIVDRRTPAALVVHAFRGQWVESSRTLLPLLPADVAAVTEKRPVIRFQKFSKVVNVPDVNENRRDITIRGVSD